MLKNIGFVTEMTNQTKWTRFEDELPPEGEQIVVRAGCVDSYIVIRCGNVYTISDEYTVDTEFLTHWHLITLPEDEV